MGLTEVRVRAPLRGGGYARQGQRTTVGEGRPVGVEALRWSEVGGRKSEQGGAGRCVCKGV